MYVVEEDGPAPSSLCTTQSSPRALKRELGTHSPTSQLKVKLCGSIQLSSKPANHTNWREPTPTPIFGNWHTWNEIHSDKKTRPQIRNLPLTSPYFHRFISFFLHLHLHSDVGLFSMCFKRSISLLVSCWFRIPSLLDSYFLFFFFFFVYFVYFVYFVAFE